MAGLTMCHYKKIKCRLEYTLLLILSVTEYTLLLHFNPMFSPFRQVLCLTAPMSYAIKVVSSVMVLSYTIRSRYTICKKRAKPHRNGTLTAIKIKIMKFLWCSNQYPLHIPNHQNVWLYHYKL